jgi:hypothetical protein
MRYQPLKDSLKRLGDALSKRSVLSAIALLGTLFTANCSDLPTSPTSALDLNNDLNAMGGQKVCSSGPEWTVVQPMTNLGGVMLLDGWDVTQTFPSGSLSNDATTITANMKLNAPRGQATRIEFNFSPAQTFVKPVDLSISPSYLAGSNPKLTLWYYDPLQGQWVKQAEQGISGNQPVVFQIYHYSGYAVSR